MDLEFHQLELRHADLRIRDAGRRRRLLAALAEQGQQVPVVVVSEEARYVLIDGYLRVEALQQLGCDTVQATSWPLSEVDALVQHHHLSGASRSPFEQSWFLARLREQGLSMDELGRRLCRSKSWVSRRLALVSTLSERVQGKVRRGSIPPHAAMKYLVPLARANKQQCEMLVEGLGDTRVSDREVAALYAGWSHADAIGRRRICAEPLLYLRALQAETAKAPATDDPGTALAKELATLSAAAWRARQRVRQGLHFDTTYRHIDLCAAWHSARDAFDELAGALLEVFVDAGPDDSDSRPQTA